MANPESIAWIYDDGGRAAAGYPLGPRADCVCRAIAIATRRPYRTVYEELSALGWNEHGTMRELDSYYLQEMKLLKKYMGELGWYWTATSGGDRMVAKMGDHLVAIINGAFRDTQAPRDTMSIEGYFKPWLA
jgi:hypothetical protein